MVRRQVFILVTGVRFPVGVQKLKYMANHASALKRIRQTETRRLLNRYKHKTTRNAIKELRSLKDAKSANALLPKVKAICWIN